MKRYLMILTGIAFLITLGAPKQSEAKVFASFSVGGNYNLLVNNPKASQRTGFNLEGAVGWRFLMASVDLGVHYDFLKNEIQWRPGARLHLGWFFFRLAIPISLDLDQPLDVAGAYDKAFNLGLLFGVGAEIKLNKNFAITGEATLSPFFINIDERGVLLPSELRLGLVYKF